MWKYEGETDLAVDDERDVVVLSELLPEVLDVPLQPLPRRLETQR